MFADAGVLGQPLGTGTLKPCLVCALTCGTHCVSGRVGLYRCWWVPKELSGPLPAARPLVLSEGVQPPDTWCPRTWMFLSLTSATLMFSHFLSKYH